MSKSGIFCSCLLHGSRKTVENSLIIFWRYVAVLTGAKLEPKKKIYICLSMPRLFNSNRLNNASVSHVSTGEEQRGAERFLLAKGQITEEVHKEMLEVYGEKTHVKKSPCTTGSRN